MIQIRFLIFALVLCTFSPLTGQTAMRYNDNKDYSATKVWNFICEDYALSGIAKIQIAKTEKGGILKLSINVSDGDFHIGGTVYVYLTDQTVIICTDKGIFQQADMETSSFYNFSAIEMSKLKKTDIQSVRFTINGKQSKFSSQTGNFTAVNKKAYFGNFGKVEKNCYLTASEIAALQ